MKTPKEKDPIRLDHFFITHGSVYKHITVPFSLCIYTSLGGVSSSSEMQKDTEDSTHCILGSQQTEKEENNKEENNKEEKKEEKENVSCEIIHLSIQNTSLESYQYWKKIVGTHVLEKIHDCLERKQNVWMEWHPKEQCGASLLACYLVRYYDMSSVESIQWIRRQDPHIFDDGIFFISVIEKIENERFSVPSLFPSFLEEENIKLKGTKDEGEER
jgi:hypothetical protein